MALLRAELRRFQVSPAEMRAEMRAEMAQRAEQNEAELVQKEAEIAALRAENATLRGETQPGAGGQATQPDAAAPSTSTAIQTVGGAAPPPDDHAGDLRQAVMGGDLATVRKWLTAGVDPNAAHELLAGWTPLHYAAQLGHVEIIGELLDHGANAQPLDRFEQTPLMQAGFWGYTEAEDLLAQRGGGEMRPTLAIGGDDPRIGRWDQAGYVTILCSAPEFSLSGDRVMVALFRV